jgi:hypothetical protein
VQLLNSKRKNPLWLTIRAFLTELAAAVTDLNEKVHSIEPIALASRRIAASCQLPLNSSSIRVAGNVDATSIVEIG